MLRGDCATSFFFWGGRTYVQGTYIYEDILAAMEEEFGAIDRLSLTYLKEVDHQGHFVAFASPQALAESKKSLSVEIRGMEGGAPFFGGLVCDGDRVTEIIEDDEASLVKETAIDFNTQRIFMDYPGRARIFTRIVAMNKKLLKSVLGSSGYSPWRLARLAVDSPTTIWKSGVISVQLANNVAAMMTRSVILLDRERIGEIQFARRHA